MAIQWNDVRANLADPGSLLIGAANTYSRAGDIFSRLGAGNAERENAKAMLALRAQAMANDQANNDRAFLENQRQFNAKQALGLTGMQQDAANAEWNRQFQLYREGNDVVQGANTTGIVMTDRQGQIGSGNIPATIFDTGTPSQGSSSNSKAAPYLGMINAAAEKYGVSPDLLYGIAQTESAWNPNAVSKAGAQGLMQFMPATAQRFGINPLDPAQAIDGSARYMKTLLDRYNGNEEAAIMAYNWGEGNVDSYLKTGKGMRGQSRPSESTNYVPLVMKNRGGFTVQPALNATGEGPNPTPAFNDFLGQEMSTPGNAQPSSNMDRLGMILQMPENIQDVRAGFDSIDGRDPSVPLQSDLMLASLNGQQPTASFAKQIADTRKEETRMLSEASKQQKEAFVQDWAINRLKQLADPATGGLTQTDYDIFVAQGKQAFGKSFNEDQTPAKGLVEISKRADTQAKENKDFFTTQRNNVKKEYANFAAKDFETYIDPEDKNSKTQLVNTMAEDLRKVFTSNLHPGDTDTLRGIVARSIADFIEAQNREDPIFPPQGGGGIETSGFGRNGVWENRTSGRNDLVDNAATILSKLKKGQVSSKNFGEGPHADLLNLIVNRMMEVGLGDKELMDSFQKKSIMNERSKGTTSSASGRIKPQSTPTQGLAEPYTRFADRVPS